jgi:3-dehydroquinate dehydratase-2
MAGVVVLNGPNLNMLGTREPEIYGTTTLSEIEELCRKRAEELGLELTFHQSNHEGELVTRIQEARSNGVGIIINAGAYTHTSVALQDALVLCEKPIIEVHISNIFARESFRHHSYVSPLAKGVICGLGAQGYLLALDALAQLLDLDDQNARQEA